MFNIKIAVLGLDIIAAVVLSFRNCVKCVPIKDVNSSKKNNNLCKTPQLHDFRFILFNDSANILTSMHYIRGFYQ